MDTESIVSLVLIYENMWKMFEEKATICFKI